MISEKYDFVDCIVVDFNIDKNAKQFDLTTEAYYPSYISNNRRKKGLLKIIVSDIRSIKMDISSEFYTDLEIKHSVDGDDNKSNEIYLAEIAKTDNSVYRINIVTDFIRIQATSVYCELHEL